MATWIVAAHPGCRQEQRPVVILDGEHSCAVMLPPPPAAGRNASLTGESVQQHETLRLAARELRLHLAEIAGLDTNAIPIISEGDSSAGTLIYIGALDRKSGRRDLRRKMGGRWRGTRSRSGQGYRIDSFWHETDPVLMLSGRRSVGALYAVYEFLQRLGVNWFRPDSAGTRIPRIGELVISPVANYYEPEMKIRGFWREEAGREGGRVGGRDSAAISPAFVKWMGRNRLNLFWLGGGPAQPLKRRGVLLAAGGFKGELARAFSASPLCCREKVRDELFSFCLKELARGAWRDADVLIFSATSWCDCPVCRELGNPSDRMLLILDELRKGLEKAVEGGELGRRVRVFGTAHGETLLPPSKKNRGEKTALFFVPPARCYNHSLADSQCEKLNTHTLELLNGWLGGKKRYKGEILFVEPCNAELFRDLPVLPTRILGYDIPYLYRHGVRGLVYQHARTADLGAHAWLNLQIARQSYRTRAPVDTLFSRYLKFIFPELQREMADYYGKLEIALANIWVWRHELTDRINRMAKGVLDEPLLPLERTPRHFTIGEPAKAVDWEETYRLIHEAGHILEQILVRDLSDIQLARLLEEEAQWRYANLTIHMTDNVLRLLTLGDDEPEMREEAVLRLRNDIRDLEQLQILSPALGWANGLKATGIDSAAQLLLSQYQQRKLSSLGSIRREGAP